VLAFKRRLDPDVVVYPVVSTVADVLATICYSIMLNSFFSSHLGWMWIGLFDLFFLSVACYILIKNYRDEDFAKTVKEFSLTLVLVSLIVNVTGSFLGKVGQVIGGRPTVYVVYPALIDTVGDVGSIVGSTATTKLALGLIGSSFSSIKQHLTEIGNAWSASLIMFSLYAITASSIHALTASSEFWKFLAQLLMTNIMAVSLMIIISFAVAIFTQKRGWNPDNFVIPIESSLTDAITTISLLIALTIMA
jgi:mgtE-like transporter